MTLWLLVRSSSGSGASRGLVDGSQTTEIAVFSVLSTPRTPAALRRHLARLGVHLANASIPLATALAAGVGSVTRRRFSQTLANKSWNGYASDNATTTRRTLTRTIAPILKQLHADGAALGLRHVRVLQAELTQRTQQHVGHGRQI